MKRNKIVSLIALTLIMSLLVLASVSAQGTWTTGIDIQNLSSASGNVIVTFYDSAGNSAGSVSDSISSFGGLNVYVPNIPDSTLPAGEYSAIVSSDTPVAATTSLQNYDLGGADIYLGTDVPATDITFPLVYRNHTSGKWNTELVIQNTGDSPQLVNLSLFTSGSSTASATDSATIPAKASHTFDISESKYAAFGPFGSAKVTSSSELLAGIAMAIRNPGTGVANVIETSYRAFGAANQGQDIVAPLVYKNFNGWTSGVNIVNTGNTPTVVDITYKNANPAVTGGPWTDSVSIPANAMGVFFTPSNATGLPNNFYGSAKITSNTNDVLVVVASQRYPVTGAQGVAYEGSLDDGTATACVSAPIVQNRSSWKTGINILNLGTSPATVAISYASSAAGIPDAADTYTIAAGSPATVYMPSDGATLSGFYGAADIKSTNGQPLLVNIANSRADKGVSSNYVGINYTCP